MYMAVIGRWNAVDPLAENHYNLTTYHYVMNNPLLYIDPFGLDTIGFNDKGKFENYNFDNDIVALPEINITASATEGNGSNNSIGTSAQAGLMMGEITRQGKAYQFFGSSAQVSDEALSAGKYIHNGDVYWQGNYRGVTSSMKNSLSTAQFVKATGKTLGALNIAVTGYQVYGDISDGRFYSAGTRAAVAGIAAGATFIPVIGWGVAIGIGVADAIWGDQFYNFVERQFEK